MEAICNSLMLKGAKRKLGELERVEKYCRTVDLDVTESNEKAAQNVRNGQTFEPVWCTVLRSAAHGKGYSLHVIVQNFEVGIEQ
jgi:hypothetical protein